MSATGQKEERGGIGRDLKGTSVWERGREVAQYRVLPEGDRQEGCLSSQLSVKSCGLARFPASICQLGDTHLLWPRGLVWEVSICVRKAGLLRKVTAERMPLLVERDAHALPVPQRPSALTLSCLLSPCSPTWSTPWGCHTHSLAPLDLEASCAWSQWHACLGVTCPQNFQIRGVTLCRRRHTQESHTQCDSEVTHPRKSRKLV